MVCARRALREWTGTYNRRYVLLHYGYKEVGREDTRFNARGTGIEGELRKGKFLSRVEGQETATSRAQWGLLSESHGLRSCRYCVGAHGQGP